MILPMNVKPGCPSALRTLGCTEAETRLLRTGVDQSSFLRVRECPGLDACPGDGGDIVMWNRIKRQKYLRVERVSNAGAIDYLLSGRKRRLIHKNNRPDPRADEIESIELLIAVLGSVLANLETLDRLCELPTHVHCHFLPGNQWSSGEVVTNPRCNLLAATAFTRRSPEVTRYRTNVNAGDDKSRRGKNSKSGGSDPPFSAFAAQKVSWGHSRPVTPLACLFFRSPASVNIL